MSTTPVTVICTPTCLAGFGGDLCLGPLCVGAGGCVKTTTVCGASFADEHSGALSAWGARPMHYTLLLLFFLIKVIDIHLSVGKKITRSVIAGQQKSIINKKSCACRNASYQVLGCCWMRAKNAHAVTHVKLVRLCVPGQILCLGSIGAPSSSQVRHVAAGQTMAPHAWYGMRSLVSFDKFITAKDVVRGARNLVTEEVRPYIVGCGAVGEQRGSQMDFEGTLVGVDDADRCALSLPTGHTWSTNWKTKVHVRDCVSRSKQTPQLQPAFAGIDGRWIDRRVIGAMASMASWYSPTRSIDMDVGTKVALRAMVGEPVDLTRYFVRAWGMYFAAMEAESLDSVIRASVPSSIWHMSTSVESFTKWMAAVSVEHSRGGSALFCDLASGQLDESVLPIFTLLTSERIETASDHFLERFWVPIPGARLYHTSQIEPRFSGLTWTSNDVLGVIEWLSSTHDVLSQAYEAWNVALMLYNRPVGWSAFGPGASAEFSIRLPMVKSRSTLLAPFLLGVEQSESAQPLPHRQLTNGDLHASGAALFSSYATMLGDYARNYVVPQWCDDFVPDWQSRVRPLFQISNGVFLPTLHCLQGMKQLHGISQLGWQVQFIAPRSVRFMRSEEFMQATRRIHFVGLHNVVVEASVDHALLAGGTVKHCDNPLAPMIRVEYDGTNYSPGIISELVRTHDAAVGIVVVDRHTNTIAHTHWCAPDQAFWHAPVSAMRDSVDYQTVTRFSTYEAYFAFCSALRLRKGLRWWLETEHYSREFDFVEHDPPEVGPKLDEVNIPDSQAVKKRLRQEYDTVEKPVPDYLGKAVAEGLDGIESSVRYLSAETLEDYRPQVNTVGYNKWLRDALHHTTTFIHSNQFVGRDRCVAKISEYIGLRAGEEIAAAADPTSSVSMSAAAGKAIEAVEQEVKDTTVHEDESLQLSVSPKSGPGQSSNTTAAVDVGQLPGLSLGD